MPEGQRRSAGEKDPPLTWSARSLTKERALDLEPCRTTIPMGFERSARIGVQMVYGGADHLRAVSTSLNEPIAGKLPCVQEVHLADEKR